MKKMSRTRKSLLYALIGSSLVWHAPIVSYAAEETQEPAPATEQAAEEQAASTETTVGQREFTLEGVEVTADRSQALPPAYAGGQVARGANLGILGNKDFMDTPFNVTSYTAQTMEDKQADTLYDVLINDPSIRFTTSAGHSNENYMIRGLEVNYQHLYFNGMQGLAPQYHVPVEFLERVEVLKGPSSFLYGGVSTSVGGAINLVPKRAGEEDITNFTTSYTSSSHLGGHIDIGRRFGENKEWGIRFNGVYADGDTEVDGQSKERLLGSLGVDYQKDKWRLSMDAYGSQENYDNGATSMYYLANGYVESAPDGSTNAYKGTSGTTRNNGVLFKGEYDIQDNLTAYAGIGKLSANATGFINGNHVLNLKSDGTATARNVFKQNFWTDTTSSDFGLRGAYQTGSVKHQLVLGASFQDTDYSNAYNQGSGNYPTNIYNPVSLADYFNSVASPAKGNKTLVTKLSSYLLSDTLSFDEDKVQLTLGVRRQNVEQTSYKYSNTAATGTPTSSTTYDSDATTPMVGLIVKPWGESVSLYANYIEALSPGTVVATTYDNANEVLAPYKTKQQEIGVKWDKGNFANTLAFFQIKMPSYMTTDNIYSYGGEQKNRGIEWNTFGSITKNFRVLGGIAYTDGELVRSRISTNKGKTPFGVPKWTMNAGVEWDTSWNKDLTLSLLAVYTGSQYIDNANTIKIPSWVRYDLGARYKTTINNVPVTYRASVENLFDKHYWAGCFSNENYATLGGPRTFKLSATFQI
ncbi:MULTISPECIES: TonB-dependent receptor [Pelosinus]|jgi:iron complex outermembrane receptor protein|uniref:TonB-dependent siderophore receptor n=1 Tax=Pelosinus fermentans B4 TaxID=1149862 RepID=I9B1N5_9FIRM|nr:MULTISPECIES: TonB-dependent siderophore receptor [Pelosinus]EIW19057.1 TonB-dependent siderophore receptor [Pelosinus fermentans B4]EIW21733.1 TonB-dependent siderophore receptor [Pelosinus fermentans A11]OAM95419.1 TonB-dependent siderophore receptor [Pelosinus fermentans DSM 17108]SDR27820.1 iron complex outermembrane recepter protein [Pelosinus fermentans]